MQPPVVITLRNTENSKRPCSEFYSEVIFSQYHCTMSQVMCIEYQMPISSGRTRRGHIYLLMEQTLTESLSYIGNEDSKSNNSCSVEILNFLQILKDLFRNEILYY